MLVISKSSVDFVLSRRLLTAVRISSGSCDPPATAGFSPLGHVQRVPLQLASFFVTLLSVQVNTVKFM